MSFRVVERALYPWHDSQMFVAGNSRSVAKQLLRVILHQVYFIFCFIYEKGGIVLHNAYHALA